jgi:hypothetical protein
MNEFQKSPQIAGRAKADGQASNGLASVLMFSALGLFASFWLIGFQISHTAAATAHRAAAANVSPELFISDESLRPNLNAVLATGDGGASIPLEELVAGVRREAFNDIVHGKKLANAAH